MTIDETYQERLILALRLKDVPGDRIGEIVAEVESHVAETGEDPNDAFGDPKTYAASLTDEHRPLPTWQSWVTIVCSGVAGALVAEGGLSLLLGEDAFGLPAWIPLLAGLAIGIPGALAVARRSTAVIDPRTGRDLVPFSPGALVLMVGTPIAIVLVAFGLIRLFG